MQFLCAPSALMPKTLINKDGKAQYWSNFLDAQADRYLEESLTKIAWRAERLSIYGKTYPVPRLSAWYSDTGGSYTYSGIRMRGTPLPDFVRTIQSAILATTGYAFNSVLLNYYRDGRDKVAWHSDNEAELGTQVRIVSVSLGAERIFRLRHRNTRADCTISLAHGSLLLMEPPMQQYWEHCLPAKAGLYEGRVNLSFRNIVSE